MQDQFLYEYAIIRVVPRVEREEFLNVGVILYSKQLKYIDCVYHLNESRIQSLFGEIDLMEVEQFLHAFERICKGLPDSGPIGKLDIPSRFRWLTATRSTVIQTSKVHPAFCSDPRQALEKIFQQMVQ